MLLESDVWVSSFSSGTELLELFYLSNEESGQNKRLLFSLQLLDVSAKHLACVVRPPCTSSSTEKLYISLDRIEFRLLETMMQETHNSASETVKNIISSNNLCFTSSEGICASLDLSFLSAEHSSGSTFHGIATTSGQFYVFQRALTSEWSLLTKSQLLRTEDGFYEYQMRGIWVDKYQCELIWWQSSRSKRNNQEQHACYSCSLTLKNNDNSSMNLTQTSKLFELESSPCILLWQSTGPISVHHNSDGGLLWIISCGNLSVIDLKTSQRYSAHLPIITHDSTSDFCIDISCAKESSGVKVIVSNRRLFLAYLPPRNSIPRKLYVFHIRLSFSSASSSVNSSSNVAVIATQTSTNSGIILIVYLMILVNNQIAEIHHITLSKANYQSQLVQQQQLHSASDKMFVLRTEIVLMLRIPGHSLGEQFQFITGTPSVTITSKKLIVCPVFFSRPRNRFLVLQLPYHVDNNQDGDLLFDALESLYETQKHSKHELFQFSSCETEAVTSRLSTSVRSQNTVNNLTSALNMLTNQHRIKGNDANKESKMKIEHPGQFFFELTQRSQCWEEKQLPSHHNCNSLTNCYIRWKHAVNDHHSDSSGENKQQVWESLMEEADSWIPRQYQHFVTVNHPQLQTFVNEHSLSYHTYDNNYRNGNGQVDERQRINVEEDERDSHFVLDVLAHMTNSFNEETTTNNDNKSKYVDVDLITLRPIIDMEDTDTAHQSRKERVEQLGRVFTPEAILMLLSYTFSSTYKDDVEGDLSENRTREISPGNSIFVHPVHAMILHQLLTNPTQLISLLTSLFSAQQSILQQQQTLLRRPYRSRSSTGNYNNSNNGESTPWSMLQSVPSQEFIYEQQPISYQAEMILSPPLMDDHRVEQPKDDEIEDIFGLALFPSTPSPDINHDDSLDEDQLKDSVLLRSVLSATSQQRRSISSPRPPYSLQQQQLKSLLPEERGLDFADFFSFFSPIPLNTTHQTPSWMPIFYDRDEGTRSRSDSRLSPRPTDDVEEEEREWSSDELCFRRLVGRAILHALRLSFQAKFNHNFNDQNSSFINLFRGLATDPQLRYVVYHVLLMVDRPIAAARMMLVWNDLDAYTYLKERLEHSADLTNALIIAKQEYYRPELDVSIIEYYLQITPSLTNYHDKHDMKRLQEYLLGEEGKSSKLIRRLNPLVSRPWSSEEMEEELEFCRDEADRGLKEIRQMQLDVLKNDAKL